jgi:hypothetical protein
VEDTQARMAVSIWLLNTVLEQKGTQFLNQQASVFKQRLKRDFPMICYGEILSSHP